ncbi:unnamed protein product [Gongylonema pulchrum]|uniref:Uncharacterized protein n=1 Tax=Gongylonema pulchrum TaxID=637853 RepID=A0A3P7MEP7_9BILA|nr:unnamed protein product [Gongylonema pulchrum]
MSELHFDIWQIFSKHIHEGAPEKIDLPQEVVAEFTSAVEGHDFELLDRCIEKAFQIVYRRMQYDYVVPFCQSECFLGHLCGSPPVSVDELIASNGRPHSNRILLPAVESNFSITQFRNRFWRMVMPASMDGSVDSSSFDHLSDAASQGSANGLVDVADDITQGQTNSSNSFEVPLFDPERDISKWNVTIPLIEPRRDPVSGHTMYVYIISVERFDVKENNGQQRCGSTTQTKIALKRSDMLFAFLTSEQELKDSTQISDLYPWNVSRLEIQ